MKKLLAVLLIVARLACLWSSHDMKHEEHEIEPDEIKIQRVRKRRDR